MREATRRLRAEGQPVSQLHLRYLNPLQSNVGEILESFEQVLVVELNCGQLSMLLRDRFLIDAKRLNKVQGQAFLVREIVAAVKALLPQSTLRELRA